MRLAALRLAAFGSILRLLRLRLAAFCVWGLCVCLRLGPGLRLLRLALPRLGTRQHHSAFGTILRLRLAAFAFGCVCVCCVWGILRLAALGWFSTALAGRLVCWLCSPRQPDAQDVDKQELTSETILRVMLGSASFESADSGPYLPHATALRTD